MKNPFQYLSSILQDSQGQPSSKRWGTLILLIILIVQQVIAWRDGNQSEGETWGMALTVLPLVSSFISIGMEALGRKPEQVTAVTDTLDALYQGLKLLAPGSAEYYRQMELIERELKVKRATEISGSRTPPAVS